MDDSKKPQDETLNDEYFDQDLDSLDEYFDESKDISEEFDTLTEEDLLDMEDVEAGLSSVGAGDKSAYSANDMSTNTNNAPPQKSLFSAINLFIFIVIVIVGLFGLNMMGILGSVPTGSDNGAQVAMVDQQASEDAPAEQDTSALPSDEPVLPGAQPAESSEEVVAKTEDPLTPFPVDEAEPELFADAASVQPLIPEEDVRPAGNEIEPPINIDVPPPVTPVMAGEVDVQPSDQVQKRIDQVETRLDEVLTRLEQNVNVHSPSNQNDEKLDTVLAELQRVTSSIDDVKARLSKLENAPKAETRTPVSNNVPMNKAAPRSEPKRTSNVTNRPAVVSNDWEIRAVQIGKALLARKSTNDMRNIVVGDTIPGLGQIKAIDYRAGHWVIEGTQGRLMQ